MSPTSRCTQAVQMLFWWFPKVRAISTVSALWELTPVRYQVFTEVKKNEGQENDRIVAFSSGFGCVNLHSPSHCGCCLGLGTQSVRASVFSSVKWEFFLEGLLSDLSGGTWVMFSGNLQLSLFSLSGTVSWAVKGKLSLEVKPPSPTWGLSFLSQRHGHVGKRTGWFLPPRPVSCAHFTKEKGASQGSGWRPCRKACVSSVGRRVGSSTKLP